MIYQTDNYNDRFRRWRSVLSREFSVFDRVATCSGLAGAVLVTLVIACNSGFAIANDTTTALADPADFDNLRIPSGNEGGANDQWIPGGFTSGGVPEAVVDLSEAPFTVVPIG